MNTHVKAVLSTIVVLVCFIVVIAYPDVFVVVFCLGLVGSVIYIVYRTFLNFFSKKVK
jgi:hypothetical protein